MNRCAGSCAFTHCWRLTAGYGAGNSARCSEIGASKLMHAQRGNVHLLMTCSSGFSRRSVGYVGVSDGWQDLMRNFKMDWEFRAAENGNIALTGEIDLPDNGEFTIAVAFGGSYQSTAAKLFQSLAEPFESHRQAYVRQWQRAVVNPKFDFSDDTSDGGGMYRLSRCVLLAHEDKVFQGAIVASMSIPWGETKGDQRSRRLSSRLDARSCAERDRAARHWPDRHATARVDLAGSHSATGRQFSTKQLDRWDRLLVGTAA